MERVTTLSCYCEPYLLSLHQPRLTDDAQLHAWHSIVSALHADDGRVVVQVMHAGALSQGNSNIVGPAPTRVRS